MLWLRCLLGRTTEFSKITSDGIWTWQPKIIGKRYGNFQRFLKVSTENPEFHENTFKLACWAEQNKQSTFREINAGFVDRMFDEKVTYFTEFKKDYQR